MPGHQRLETYRVAANRTSLVSRNTGAISANADVMVVVGVSKRSRTVPRSCTGPARQVQIARLGWRWPCSGGRTGPPPVPPDGSGAGPQRLSPTAHYRRRSRATFPSRQLAAGLWLAVLPVASVRGGMWAALALEVSGRNVRHKDYRSI